MTTTENEWSDRMNVRTKAAELVAHYGPDEVLHAVALVVQTDAQASQRGEDHRRHANLTRLSNAISEAVSEYTEAAARSSIGREKKVEKSSEKI